MKLRLLNQEDGMPCTPKIPCCGPSVRNGPGRIRLGIIPLSDWTWLVLYFYFYFQKDTNWIPADHQND